MDCETTEVITKKGKTIRIRAAKDYWEDGKSLLKLKNTGNGYIAKFPSDTSARQSQYICMDYEEAHLLWLALCAAFKGDLNG